MTLPISTKIPSVSPKFAAANSEAMGAKATDKAADAGFASLFSGLDAKNSKSAEQVGTVAHLPGKAAKGGKILPVGEKGLAGDAGKQAADSESTADDDDAVAACIVIPLGLPGSENLAAGLPAEANAETAAHPAKEVAPTSDRAAPRATAALPGFDAEVKAVAKSKLSAAGMAKTPVATTASKRDAGTGEGPAMAAPEGNRTATTGDPAKPSDAAARPAGFALKIAAAVKPVGHGATDAGDRNGASENAERGSDSPLASNRSAAPDQIVRLSDLSPAQHSSPKPMQVVAGQSGSATSAPGQTSMSAEAIAHFVERISLARDFDKAQSVSFVVKHDDFGPLTLTFDHSRNGLDVQVAAQDAETQRALASAMASDRNLARPGDAHNTVHASHGATAGGERNAASSGQAFASNDGRQGDRTANQSFGQEPQHGRRATGQGHAPRHGSARPGSTDDALYA